MRIFILIIILSSISLKGFGQFRPKPFVGIDRTINAGFKNRSYGSLAAGVELFNWKFIAPEVSYEYTFGTLHDVGNYSTEIMMDTDYLSRSFRSNVLSLGMKLYYGQGLAKVFILPKYSWANTTVKGRYWELTDKGLAYEFKEEQKYSERVEYFQIGVGYEADIFETELVILSFRVFYNSMDLSQLFEQIDFSEQGYPPKEINTESIGLAIYVLFNPYH